MPSAIFTSLLWTMPAMPSLISAQVAGARTRTNAFGSNDAVLGGVAAGDGAAAGAPRARGTAPRTPPRPAFQFTGSRHAYHHSARSDSSLPSVHDRGERLDALAQRRGLGVEVDPRAPAPRLAPHGDEVDVARLQVVLGERPRLRDERVPAVGPVAPAVERAGEAASRRSRGPGRRARRGGGTRSGRPARRRRRCAPRAPTGRGSRTRRSRARPGSPRAGRPSARPAATAARPPAA